MKNDPSANAHSTNNTSPKRKRVVAMPQNHSLARRARIARKLPAFTHCLLALAAFSLLFCSCSRRDKGVQVTYGRSAGVDYKNSLNGTKAYRTMLQEKGFTVDRYSRFSPRLNKYSTVVWFPDNHEAPRESAIEFAETWLAEGWSRTLIYVGRDFDAESIYWDQLAESAKMPSEKIDYRRQGSRAYARANQNRVGYFYEPTLECDWFKIVDRSHAAVSELSGDFADDIDVEKAEMTVGRMLEPTTEVGYVVEVLLEANGEPFVYTIKQPHWSDSKIVVVNNASFLLNLPLVNHEHRKLAEVLAEETIVYDPVVFIEQAGGVKISSSEFDNPNRWSWVAKKPLRYIVPHLLFWTVLFCFVYFPIFGRPKHTQKKATTNFRDHVRALGRLLEQTNSRDTAHQWIEECKDRTSNRRSKN